MNGTCAECKGTLRWVVDHDRSDNLVCDTCKYIVRQVPHWLRGYEPSGVDLIVRRGNDGVVLKLGPLELTAPL